MPDAADAFPVSGARYPTCPDWEELMRFMMEGLEIAYDPG